MSKIAAFALVGAVIAGPAAALWRQAFEGYLGDGQSKRYTATLTPGSYTIYAKGDHWAGDLDMRFVEAGVVIAEDDLSDNEPLLEIEVYRTGTFEIVVENYGRAQGFEGVIFED